MTQKKSQDQAAEQVMLLRLSRKKQASRKPQAARPKIIPQGAAGGITAGDIHIDPFR